LEDAPYVGLDVFGEMTRAAAISRSVRPSAIWARTSRSRAVSTSRRSVGCGTSRHRLIRPGEGTPD